MTYDHTALPFALLAAAAGEHADELPLRELQQLFQGVPEGMSLLPEERLRLLHLCGYSEAPAAPVAEEEIPSAASVEARLQEKQKREEEHYQLARRETLKNFKLHLRAVPLKRASWPCELPVPTAYGERLLEEFRQAGYHPQLQEADPVATAMGGSTLVIPQPLP